MSDWLLYCQGMNLNREQFLTAIQRAAYLSAELKGDYPEMKLYPVFSRFGPRSGQCEMTSDLRKIVMAFPAMLAPNSDVPLLRELVVKMQNNEPLPCDPGAVENRLLDPELKLYCGDVLIEFRPTILKYEPLRRLQQDPRLPQALNEVGNVRVVAGSLVLLAGNEA